MAKRIAKTSDLEALTYRGGTDADSQKKPSTFTERFGKKTTTNTPAAAYTYTTAVADGATFTVTCSVTANRTDVAGTTAKFTMQGTWRRSGSSLVAVGSGTPEVLIGEPTDATHCDGGATSWRAALDGTSGLTVRVIVTGENAKTIQWGGVIEVLEVQP